jgi:RNA polymerase sigma factor (sigma-70 family)
MPSGSPSPLLRFIRRIAAPCAAGEPTDGQLLDRFAGRRDEAAFAALLQRHGPMVLGVCQSVLGNAHDAEDAFQATFLVLVRKAGSIGKPDAVGSWLHGVAYRLAVKARAEAARRRAHERRKPTMPVAEPLAELIGRDLRPVLHEEVSRLPDKYRAPFVLCYLEGKTNEEAARLLGWPKGTVLSSLARARARLRARLTRRGVALSAGAFAAVLAQGTAPAAVPAALAESTLKAALLFAAGPAAVGGGISASVLASAQGMLRAMFLARAMTAAAGLLAVSLAGAGAVALAGRTWHADSPGPGRAAEQMVRAAGALGRQPGNGPREDREALQGTWVVVRAELEGVPADAVQGRRLVFTRDRFTIPAGPGEVRGFIPRGEMTGALELDPAAEPRRLDLAEGLRTLRGIYSLEGDSLRICLGDSGSREPPRAFAMRPDGRQLLLALRRE